MNKLLILITFCMASFIHNVVAQDTECSKNLGLAKDAYLIGDFKKVKEFLEPCTKQGMAFNNSKEKNRALEILALSAIAVDSIEIAKAYILSIVKTNAEYTQDPALENIIFIQLLGKVRAENLEVRVSSVSKKAEDINRAPASVELITREEMINRGYLDIVDALADIPGFHISKTFATTYGNIYQLGFRQENSERTLVMVDGVEENDLWLNWAYLSRQYPLSSVKAIEVLYGPSSTMYGPRAFVGAINIITYDPKEIPKDPLLIKGENAKDRPVYMFGSIQRGGYNTTNGDVTVGIRGKESSDFSLQLTGKYYISNEHDMGTAEFYDYEASDIDHLKYTQLNLNSTKFMGRTLTQYMKDFNLPAVNPNYTVVKDAAGEVKSINLTSQGIDLARMMDRKAYTGTVNGAPLAYSNDTKDYYVGMKMKVSDVLIGFRHWGKTSGVAYYQDINEAGSRNGSKWAPENTTIYAKIDKTLSERIQFSNLSTFEMHRLSDQTTRVGFISFGDPQTQLHLAHLVYPDSLILGNRGVVSKDSLYGTERQVIQNSSLIKQGWRNKYYYYGAQQLRNETRFFYDYKKLSVSSGLDFRSTYTQGDYLFYTDYNTKYASVEDYQAKQKNKSLAQELGISDNQVPGSNIYTILEIGLYAQTTYRFGDKISLVGGARIDYNKPRASVNYDLVTSPRLAFVYHEDLFTFKVIASKGFQNVSQNTKYSTGGGRVANPSLKPEEIAYVNLELSGKTSKELNKDFLNWELTGFAYRVQNAVASETDTKGVRKNFNTGTYEITGTMASIILKPRKNIHINFNHTLTMPFQTESKYDTTLTTKRRIGDIASHLANASVTGLFRNVGPFNTSVNLRANYVGDRPEGPETTQKLNFGLDSSMVIPQYLIFSGNIGLSIAKFPNARLDFTVNNILGMNLLDTKRKTYFDPGVKQGEGTFNLPWDPIGKKFADNNVPWTPQRGRFMLVKLTFDL